MDKAYRRLMTKSRFAAFIDSVFFVALCFCLAFLFFVIFLGSFLSAFIIAIFCALLGAVFIYKFNQKRFLKFKKALNEKIKEQILLEKIILQDKTRLFGYTPLGKDLFLNEKGQKAILLKTKRTVDPDMLLKILKQHKNIKQVLSTFDFDKECIILASRLKIELIDKQVLLKIADFDMDEDRLHSMVENEVRIRSEKKPKVNAFSYEKTKKYLVLFIFFLILSRFMGYFRGMYLFFAFACLVFAAFGFSGFMLKSRG